MLSTAAPFTSLPTYTVRPLMIAEGHRPGNFKPSAETIDALQRLMLAAGIKPPEAIQPATVYVQGEVGKPGRYPLSSNMTLADLIRILCRERREKVRSRRGARDCPMVAMLGRRALGTERQNDIGAMPAKKVDNLPDKPIGIDVAKHAVAMPGRRQRCNPEYLRGRRQLAASARREFGARRNGDAGILPGIPVGRAEEIDSNVARCQFRDCSAHRERLIVGMGEDAGETHRSIAVRR